MKQKQFHGKKPFTLEAKQFMRFKARHLPSKPANSAKLRGPTSDFILGDGKKKQYERDTAKEKSRGRVQTWRQGPCVSTAQDTQGRVRLLSVFWPSLRGTNSMRHGSPPPWSSTTLCCCPAFILQSVASRLDEEGRGKEEEGQEDKMAWEGLSPNQSICFLVCPPGWLGPTQYTALTHSINKHTSSHTEQHTCSNDSLNTVLMCFLHFSTQRKVRVH